MTHKDNQQRYSPI